MTKVSSRLQKDIYKLHNEQRYPENTEDSHKSRRKRKTQKAQYIKRQGTRCMANKHLKRCPMSQVRSERTRLRFHFTLPGKNWVCQKNQLSWGWEETGICVESKFIQLHWKATGNFFFFLFSQPRLRACRILVPHCCCYLIAKSLQTLQPHGL